jgi:hypothetical protein
VVLDEIQISSIYPKSLQNLNNGWNLIVIDCLTSTENEGNVRYIKYMTLLDVLKYWVEI